MIYAAGLARLAASSSNWPERTSRSRNSERLRLWALATLSNSCDEVGVSITATRFFDSPCAPAAARFSIFVICDTLLHQSSTMYTHMCTHMSKLGVQLKTAKLPEPPRSFAKIKRNLLCVMRSFKRTNVHQTVPKGTTGMIMTHIVYGVQYPWLCCSFGSTEKWAIGLGAQ